RRSRSTRGSRRVTRVASSIRRTSSTTALTTTATTTGATRQRSKLESEGTGYGSSGKTARSPFPLRKTVTRQSIRGGRTDSSLGRAVGRSVARFFVWREKSGPAGVGRSGQAPYLAGGDIAVRQELAGDPEVGRVYQSPVREPHGDPAATVHHRRFVRDHLGYSRQVGI